MRLVIARPVRWIPVILWIAAVGCATYAGGLRPMLDRLGRGDPAGALARLENSPREDDALYHLERGLLLRLSGRLQESSRAFDEADRISEELYTKSVSQEAAALAISDRIRSYRPPAYERLLARHYQIRNYLEEGDGEAALVEARRCEQLLNELQDAKGGEPLPWIPAVYLSAALAHEAAGRPDDALRLYRRLYRDGGDAAAGLPQWTARRMHRLARVVGVAPEELGVADPSLNEPEETPDLVTTVVWVERGLVPEREEVRLRVPILKSEAAYDPMRVGFEARDRAIQMRAGFGPDLSRLEISYWLEIALPAMPSGETQSGPSWLGVHGDRVDGVTVGDVGRLARESLDEQMPSIVVRSIVRAIAKYGATKGVEKRAGEIGGILTNVLGAATERAETRMWLSLPDRIDLIVVDSSSPADAVPVGWGEPAAGFRRIELKPLSNGRILFGSCRDLVDGGGGEGGTP